MNFELFGLILSWVGFCWSLLVIFITFYYYTFHLTEIGRKVTTITLNKQFIVLVVSLVYIICYYIR